MATKKKKAPAKRKKAPAKKRTAKKKSGSATLKKITKKAQQLYDGGDAGINWQTAIKRASKQV